MEGLRSAVKDPRKEIQHPPVYLVDLICSIEELSWFFIFFLLFLMLHLNMIISRQFNGTTAHWCISRSHHKAAKNNPHHFCKILMILSLHFWSDVIPAACVSLTKVKWVRQKTKREKNAQGRVTPWMSRKLYIFKIYRQRPMKYSIFFRKILSI